MLYSPGVWASVITGADSANPQKLPRILHAETNLTLAPAVGQGRLIIADPDGHWSSTLRPNDQVSIVFSSRARQTLSGTVAQQRSGVSWSGVVDTARQYEDPRADYGRACWIELASYWALLAKTAVPLTRYFTGTYITANTSIIQFANQAIVDVQNNIGIAITPSFDPRIAYVQTAPNQLPNDWTDPTYQNWASFLLTTLTIAGIEVYFDEAGTFVLRPLQGMNNSATGSIPSEEVFSAQFGGSSDMGLVTNVAVAYGLAARSSYGIMVPQQPIGSDPFATAGTLPPALLGADGNPAPRLGQRFISLKVGWLGTADAASRYGNAIRALGMANADAIECQTALNGDLRIGTTIAFPGLDRRYYLSTVSHMYEQNQDTETTLSGRYGMALDAAWSPAIVDGSYSPITTGGAINLAPTDPTQVASANLPALAGDPDVRWTRSNTPISVADIDRFLRQHNPPSPLLPYANQIWTDGQQYGILPEFALAVWEAETSQATAGVGRTVGAGGDYNPGSVTDSGGFITYLDYPSAIGAWYAYISAAPYVASGLTTVSQIGAVYAPVADNNANWIPNVDRAMRALRQGALVQSVANAPGEQTPPAGSPRATIVSAAESMVGGSYVWGAESPSTRTFDCSGLTEWAYKQAGLSFGVGRSTAQVQYDYCQAIADATRQPADLLFFHVVADGLGDYINHVALYVGGGQIVQAAQPSVGIIQDVLTEDSINASYVATRRHPQLA